jgi:hypothetical protein
MNDSIIVYRNPLEKTMWEFWLSPQGMELMFKGAIALAIIFAGVYLYSRWDERRRFGGRRW